MNTMKVKAKWASLNPFVEDSKAYLVSEGEVLDVLPFEMVEKFAREKTPEGYWLCEVRTEKDFKQYSNPLYLNDESSN